MPSQKDQVVSKQGEPINEGDHVYTKIRGGRHEGDVSQPRMYAYVNVPLKRPQVEKIVTTKDEADAEGVKNPPKVSEGMVVGVKVLTA